MKPRVLAPLIAAVLACGPASARAQDYPRLGLYGICSDEGLPLLDAGGNLNGPMLDAVARYHEVILPVTPITPYRPDIAAALRARRPTIQLVAYVPGQNIWDAYKPDSAGHFPTRYRHLVDSLGGQLYNRSGQYYSLGRVNFAKRTGGRYVMAEAAADLFHDAVVASGTWNGIFIDVLCSSIGWTQTPAESVDYVRAGYPSFAAFDAAWAAGVDTLGDRLRRLSGSTFVMIGNCGQGTNFESYNGWMRENFPLQNGGDWYQNMFRDPGGYLAGDLRFRPPQHNYISTIPSGAIGQEYSAVNARKARFGLASAALGDGWGAFNEGAPSQSDMTYLGWWYDEYAVDLSTGMSSSQLQHTGWLGQALGAWRQMIWIGTAPDAVTNPGFESDVTSGWTYFTNHGATRTRDAATFAVGAASAKFHVPSVGAVAWSTSFTTTGSIPMAAGGTYSATFWAKASVPRPITVVAAITAGQLASRIVTIDTTWTQYQVALLPASSGSVMLQFHLGAAASDVWLDDCHLQAGATALYRRDFQDGIVLVNPSSAPLTVPLEREFRRILGSVDPFTNDGALVTQVTVGASDALFLIGDDQIPPAGVTDLQTFTPPPTPQTSSRPPRR